MAVADAQISVRFIINVPGAPLNQSVGAAAYQTCCQKKAGQNALVNASDRLAHITRLY